MVLLAYTGCVFWYFYLAKSWLSYILIAMTLMVFLISFFLTEVGAWAAHKYLMHGFLWNLHLDHHIHTGNSVQKNDAFALIFAIPSFFSILIGSQYGMPLVAIAGYGIMAYGAVYFVVHESIIHRRFNFARSQNRYFLALIRAHAQHHAVRTKEGADNFGMLFIHPKYFIKSFSR